MVSSVVGPESRSNRRGVPSLRIRLDMILAAGLTNTHNLLHGRVVEKYGEFGADV